MDADLLDDLAHLPEVLVPDHDTLRMLASCYLVCQAYFAEISNASRTDAAWNDDLRAWQRSFQRLLQAQRQPATPVEQRTITPLREALRAQQRQEALARCAALLKALSAYIATLQRTKPIYQPLTARPSAALGNVALLISSRRPSALAALGSRLPKLPEAISDTLDNYHPQLHITPTRVESWHLVAHGLRQATARLLQRRVQQRQLTIAVSPFTLDAALHGAARPGFPDDEEARFVLEGVGDEAAQSVVLQRLLRQCHAAGVGILVLPELRIPPRLLQVIQTFLRQQARSDLQDGKGLLLVVAGSWHVPEGAAWVNRSTVLDDRGKVVWTHDKLAEYHITPKDVQQHPHLKQQLGVNDYGGVEAIRTGQALQFCDCALGRLAVAICAGFFHDPVARVLKASGANIFLVPTMTPDIRRLEERAHDLVASQHAATFAANCGTIAWDHARQQPRDHTACFYRLPIAGAQPVHLTQVLAGGPPPLHLYPPPERLKNDC